MEGPVFKFISILCMVEDGEMWRVLVLNAFLPPVLVGILRPFSRLIAIDT